jgi:hypothetical protein
VLGSKSASSAYSRTQTVLSDSRRFDVYLLVILSAILRPEIGDAARLKHDPEKARPGLDPGWPAVSRLREALGAVCALIWRFGGRSQAGKDHAQTTS